jgi:hypothetical protein
MLEHKQRNYSYMFNRVEEKNVKMLCNFIREIQVPLQISNTKKDICMFFTVNAGTQTDIYLSKSILRLREDQSERDPCKNYGYEGYINCLQREIRLI